MAAAATLSPIAAGGLAVAYTLCLVLPFYASPTTRPRPGLDRDDDRVIRSRIRLVSTTCVLCSVVTVTLLRFYLGFDWRDTLHLLGWWPIGRRETGRPLLLTLILFAGPFFEKAYAEERFARWTTGEPLQDDVRTLRWWRNIVVVPLLIPSQGPLSEEILFRSLLVPLYLISSSTSTSPSLPLVVSKPSLPILLSPLPFALAHIHHLHESRLTRPHVPFFAHLAVTVLQFCYTALFGWFAAFLFVRTGSLLACVVTHAFCNWMGLPRFYGQVRKQELFGDGWAIVPVTEVEDEDDGDGGEEENEEEGLSSSKDDSDGNGLRQRNTQRQKPTTMMFVQPSSTAWDASTIFCTVTYYALLPLGAGGFYLLLWPATNSANGLVEGW